MTRNAFDHGGTVFATARRLGVQPADLLDFSASINPLGLPDSVRAALAAAVGDLVHYPDNDCTQLVAALADRHDLPPECICAGNGSTELIYLLPRLVAGRRALIVAPPFSEYGRALAREGWQIDYFHLSPEEGFSLDPAAVARALNGIDLLVVANPGNPTGRLYSRAVMMDLLDLATEKKCFLAVDEAFIDLAEEESMVAAVTATPTAIVLRSLTKFFAMPGLRAGFAVGHPDVARRLRELREPWSVGTLAQAAGAAAVGDTAYIAASKAFLTEEINYVIREMTALTGLTTFPSAANFVLARIEGTLTAAALRDRLLDDRILIRDCSSFPGLGDRFFRVAVRTREENVRLIKALRRAGL